MATLTIRNLDEEVKEKLRVRAAHNGRSMEAEVREIIAAAVDRPTPPEYGLGTWLHDQFMAAGFGDVELDIPERTELPRIIDFDQ